AILGLVFNHPTRPPAARDESDTIPTILRLSHVRSFGELPDCEGLPATWPRHRDALIARLDIQGLLEALGLRKLARGPTADSVGLLPSTLGELLAERIGAMVQPPEEKRMAPRHSYTI